MIQRTNDVGARLMGALLLLALASPCTGMAQNQPETVVEITSSKIPQPVDSTPSMLTVVSGKELRDRNANDLRTALSLVAGVDIAPGGDAGPAGSVPGMWGLREFDAFLLVVDGIPWGGVFNPALTTLSLANVERIEVQRGAAPVMYGATSFVGVIHIIHAAAGEAASEASIAVGSRGTVNAAVVTSLARSGPFSQSLYLDTNHQRFAQADAKLNRGHFLYRAAADLGIGKLRLDLDATALRQHPYSPHPREGRGLAARFPLDANVNPRDARADENRLQLTAGLERDLGFGKWSTLVSVGHAHNDNVRGYLRPDFAADGATPNADGFRQGIATDYAYLDTRIDGRVSGTLAWTAGVDWQYGNGTQHSDNVEYAVLPSGANAPASGQLPVDESTRLHDRRQFGGVYAQLEWTPTAQWNLVAGLRYNDTRERRDGQAVDHHAAPGEVPFAAADRRTKTGLSGSLAASYAVWTQGADRVTVFANYRDTYKPAAIDFGPEAEGRILQPETARSIEAGVKGRLMAGRLDWELALFRMNFANLVIRENVGGLPALANAGTERFKGAEIEGGYRIGDDLRVMASYAYHDARFVDYARLRPDGSIQQLGGKRLELSPQQIGALGLIYAPKQALQASLVYSRVGSRFLNKGNSVTADPYNMVDAGLGYRFAQWTVRIDGYNLANSRAPVAESEIGDAQFYRLPARSVLLSASTRF